MALVQCTNCGKKIIEDDDFAILHCPHCGNGAIRVIEDDKNQRGLLNGKENDCQNKENRLVQKREILSGAMCCTVPVHEYN